MGGEDPPPSPLESSIIDRACEALNGMERTQLVQEAEISEASRLGIRWTADPVEPLKTSWPYMPDRGDEPTGVRVSVTVSLSVAERPLAHFPKGRGPA